MASAMVLPAAFSPSPTLISDVLSRTFPYSLAHAISGAERGAAGGVGITLFRICGVVHGVRDGLTGGAFPGPFTDLQRIFECS